jgi:hypothetical protein
MLIPTVNGNPLVTVSLGDGIALRNLTTSSFGAASMVVKLAMFVVSEALVAQWAGVHGLHRCPRRSKV